MTLKEKQQFSVDKLLEIKQKINECDVFLSDNLKNLCVYTTGSFARSEATNKSDLDIFIIGENTDDYKYGKIDEINVFSELIKINKELKFPEFSNDGEFLKIFKYNEVEKIIGSPSDDHHNWFTARMLLILESKCIFNQDKYLYFIEKIIQVYLRDEQHEDFKLYFLLNDILRFWRTLCLNYEVSRTQQKKWEKKNISLKFSRRLTVFATIIYISVFKIKTDKELLDMIQKTPWERLKESIGRIDNKNVTDRFNNFEEEYNKFLDMKERYNPDEASVSVSEELKELSKSNTFKELISIILLESDHIDEDLKLFLIS